VPYEPRRLLLAITTEHEALRALLQARRDIEAREIFAQARSCARTLLQFALAVRRAEKPAVVRPVLVPLRGVSAQPSLVAPPEAQPTLEVGPRDALTLPSPARCQRRCRGPSPFFFPGL